MDEEDLLKCLASETEWNCPVCGQSLSRKQTLQTHLLNIHGIRAGNSPKRYKLYEYDSRVPIPRSTAYTASLPSSETAVPYLCEDQQPVPIIAATDPIILQSGAIDIEPEDYANDSDGMESLDSDGSESLDDNLLKNLPNQIDNTPLYVIPPQELVYESTMTKFHHLLCVSAFVTRHNLSDTAVKDLLSLIQLHLPVSNIGETHITELKSMCGFGKDYLNYHLYCDYCKKLFSGESDQCETPTCAGSKLDPQSKKYFATSDLKKQITEVLARKGMWECVSNTCTTDTTSSTVVSDIRSSSGYKELLMPGGFLHNNNNITLSLFTDGVPLFKSSGVSMWPVYLLINEIPPNERFLRKNMLLWGIWQGCGKPKMTMFLKPLVLDLMELYANGLTLDVNGNEEAVKAKLIVATMDLQARAYITNMTQHNGEFGCLYCMEPGIIVASGAAHCRAYPARESVMRREVEVRETGKLALHEGKRINGFFGESVLTYIPDFSLTKNIVIDYMHGTLLGITKRLLVLWLDAKYKEMPYYIGNNIKALDNHMLKIQPPYLIHRNPRILTNTYTHWKASELRNWLLFYSLPCLVDIIPPIYLKHFSCLVESTYILLGEGIGTTEMDRAEELLKAFVFNIEALYGTNNLSLNVHNLTHLVSFVKLWGPLWGYSCFSFESFNGELKQAIHGTGNVCRQVFWMFQAQKRIAQMSTLAENESTKQYLQSMMDTRKDSKGTDAYQCKVKKMIPLPNPLDEEIAEHLSTLVDNYNTNDIKTTTKIIRNGYVMYSNKCSKVKKHNSYTIAVERLPDVAAVEIHTFLVHTPSSRVFAVGRTFTSNGGVLPGRAPHLMRLIESKKLAVIKAETLREPLFIIRKGADLFAAYLPNHCERD